MDREYVIVEDTIEPNDWFIVFNPHPESSLKNVIKQCLDVEDNYIVPRDDEWLVYRQYPKEWCTKIEFIDKNKTK